MTSVLYFKKVVGHICDETQEIILDKILVRKLQNQKIIKCLFIINLSDMTLGQDQAMR